MRLFAAVAAAVLMCGVAEARTVTYQYLGGEISPRNCDIYPQACLERPPYRIVGGVIFDLARIPGGSLANSSIEFVATDISDWRIDVGILYRLEFSFMGPAGSVYGERIFDERLFGNGHRAALDWSWTPFVGLDPAIFSGSFLETFNPMFFDTHFRLSFGSKSQVIAWDIEGINGGSYDWTATSRMSDRGGLVYWDSDDGNGLATQPGEWTNMSPVPLPASALALLASLGALVAAGARHRRGLSIC